MSTDSWDDRCQAAFADHELESPPSLLYHYTSPSNFLRIVNTGCLSATHVRYMDDPLEVSYGRAILNDALRQATPGWKVEEYENFKRQLLFMSQTDASMITPVYAVCFSTEDNDMSQWDRYGGRGSGFAVGFDGNELWKMKKVGGTFGDNALIMPVVYDETEQYRQLMEVLRPTVRLWEEANEVTSEDERANRKSTLTHYASWFIMKALCTFKHPGFNAENEWRLVYTKGTHVLEADLDAEFRDGKGGLVPFVRLAPTEDAPLPLRRVVCGPRSSTMETRVAAMAVLRKKKYWAVVDEYADAAQAFIKDPRTPVRVALSSLAGTRSMR